MSYTILRDMAMNGQVDSLHPEMHFMLITAPGQLIKNVLVLETDWLTLNVTRSIVPMWLTLNTANHHSQVALAAIIATMSPRARMTIMKMIVMIICQIFIEITALTAARGHLKMATIWQRLINLNATESGAMICRYHFQCGPRRANQLMSLIR